MTESDTDIYAKLTEGDSGVTVDPNAEPLDRETPRSMAPESVAPSLDGLADHAWTHAWVECEHNDLAISVFIVTADIESAQNGNGELVLDGARVIAGNQRVFGEDEPLRVRALQPVDFETAFERASNADFTRIEPNHYNHDLTVSPIGRDDQFDPTASGPDWSDIDEDSEWFVVRDASCNSRDSHHCYEVYFPEEALRFRDHPSILPYPRPPVLVEDDYSISNEHTFVGEFGVIATECHRVTPEQVPASDAEMQSIREEARATFVDETDAVFDEHNEDVQIEIEEMLDDLEPNE